MPSGGEGKIFSDIQLCFTMLADGGVVFDAFRETRRMQERPVGYYGVIVDDVPVSDVRVPFDQFKPRGPFEPPAPLRVIVKDPWKTKYLDIRQRFDALDGFHWIGASEAVEKLLRLPGGQLHRDVDDDILVAEVCGLSPPRIVTVVAGTTELTGVNLAGDSVGSVHLRDASHPAIIGEALAELARGIDGDVRLVTQGGTTLDMRQRTTSLEELLPQPSMITA